ncbi:MAG: hypothetical protein IJ320_05130 [Phascolarctobacterium sp.]|nr:hypothetical protein [Phascolarctobacterium sp.]
MSFTEVPETIFFNTESDIFDEDDAIVDQKFKSFKEIGYNKNDFWINDYIYYSNDDDDYISDFINKKLNEDDASNKNGTSSVANNHSESANLNTGSSEYIDINITSETPITLQKSDTIEKYPNISIQRSGWKVVSSINRVKIDNNTEICISYQIYNKKHYVVLSKIFKRRKPRNFAIPVSVSEFIAHRIAEAFNKKDKIKVTNNTSSQGWLLFKNYGTIYPHPENYITVSHQRYKNKNYVVLAKYDWHKNPRTFAFSINSSIEIRDALLKEYNRGKKNGEKIYKYFFR